MDKKLRDELLEMFPWVDHTRDINSFDDIYQTVKASPGPYGDMTPRNLAGSGLPEVAGKKEEMFKRITNSLMECLNKYCTDQNTFDAWHKETCLWLTDALECLCKKGIIVKPGKAQKLINMSLKHIFCFDSAEEAALNGTFQFCHVPVDKYLLSWYYREVKGMGTLPDDKLKWGHFEYEEYYRIQLEIRNYLADKKRNLDYIDGKGNPLTPFESEFYVWNEEKLIRTADAFINELNWNNSTKWMKCGTLRNQFKTIFAKIEKKQ